MDAIKSNETAEIRRAEGNKLFLTKNFFDALLKYNESLCHAEIGSEAIGMAYANRSAVYYEIKFFEKCLKNIDLARRNGYPLKNILILEKRAEKCLEQIKEGFEARKDQDPFDYIQLSYELNSKFKSISNCLELRRNQKFGRYVITNRDLKVGDIVAIEKPYFRIIKSDFRYEGCQETNRYQRCGFCLKSNVMDLIPCKNCATTMYCSDECMTRANRDSHKYECSISNSLLKSGVMQMAMKIFFQSLSMFDGSIDDLETFFNENVNLSASVYDCDASNSDDKTTSKSYLISLLCLARNNNDYASDSPENLFKMHPELSYLWESHEEFIRKFILRTLQVGDCNFHGISGWSLKKYTNQIPQMIGIGCYPFMSLINHSCAPNVNRICVEDKIILLIERPIKKGEQIFDCYKHTFFTQPKVERQCVLLSNYGFNCDCVACTNDFPVFHQLKSINKSILKAAKKGKSQISKLNCNQAKQCLRDYCEKIQQNYEAACPSAEIVLLQECLVQCLSIIIKPIVVIP